MEIYRKFVQLLFLPIFLKPFFKKEVGSEYGVGFLEKSKLLFQIYRINKKIRTATSCYEHVQMAKAILEVPKSLQGDVVECGCWKGGSTASLSLICQLAGRKLIVFDSFCGLPTPKKNDEVHHAPHIGKTPSYEKGNYSGSLDEVRNNIKNHGALNVCEFVEGYFEDTMPKFFEKFNSKIVFSFLDVDLTDSLKVCVFYIWPFLQKTCHIFTHEASHLEVSALFFDKEWWDRRLNTDFPSLIGAGSGTCFHPSFGTPIGYTTKSKD